MEQAATSGKQAAQALFDHLKIDKQVSLETATLTHKARYKYLDPLVTALSKTANRLS